MIKLSLPVALLVFVWLLWPAVAHAQGWYNLSWSYRKTITIDFTKVSSGPHTSFPVLVNLPADPNLVAHARAAGQDILFTLGRGTKLNHEFETYTTATGALIAWVQVPSLSSSANTVLYMYYGNAAATNQQNTSGTWDANYKAVWHLKETGNGTAGEFKDSTINANNAQGGGGSAAKTPAPVAAQIGNGQNFDNTNTRYITAPHSASLNLNVSVTLSAWINMRTFGTGNDTDTIVGKHDESGTPWTAHYKLALHDATGGSAPPKVALYKDGTDDTATAAGATGLTANTWYYVVATFSGNTAGNSALVYLDGVQNGTGALNTVTFTSSYPVSIGGRVINSPAPGTPADMSDGIIDEVRISNSVRSAGWILTEYKNQGTPSTF